MPNTDQLYTFSVWTEHNTWEGETWTYYILAHVDDEDKHEQSVDVKDLYALRDEIKYVSDVRYSGLAYFNKNEIEASDDEDKDEYGCCLGYRPKNTFLYNFDLQRLINTLNSEEAEKALYKGGFENFGENMVEYVYETDEEEPADD